MTMTETARRINDHLKRFENDPVINATKHYLDRHGRRQTTGTPYYHAHSWRSGNRVMVNYVTYQGTGSLTKPEAEAYLAWLDAGNVGTHYQMNYDNA